MGIPSAQKRPGEMMWNQIEWSRSPAADETNFFGNDDKATKHFFPSECFVALSSSSKISWIDHSSCAHCSVTWKPYLVEYIQLTDWIQWQATKYILNDHNYYVHQWL